MDYNFTAKVEQEFDEIAEGKVMLKDMVKGEQRLVSADELIEALA